MANTSKNRLSVNKLYNELLGRDASFGAGSELDADYWLGKSEADIRSGISGSSEFLNRKDLIDSGVTDESTLDKMVGVGGTKTNLHRDYDANNADFNKNINWAGTADDTAAILADIGADTNNITLPTYQNITGGGTDTGTDTGTENANGYLTMDDLTKFFTDRDAAAADTKSGNEDGMGNFMKFMMFMNMMRPQGGMGGGSQYGYGGLNPGGVQSAYNPMDNFQGMMDGFKSLNSGLLN